VRKYLEQELQQGLDFEVMAWQGLFLPKETGEPIVRRLNEALSAALDLQFVRERKARLALELLLNAASRMGDGITLGRQRVKDGWLIYTQEKNRRRKPVKVETPIPAPLAATIEACPSSPESLTFLTNEWGRPFSKRNFNNWFRKQVLAAGLPDTCVPHGLRKAGCRIMAENDCTPHEIAAVSGHASLKEVERYTKAADRKRLAARAQAKIAAAGNMVPLAVVGR
jgi:integrase